MKKCMLVFAIALLSLAANAQYTVAPASCPGANITYLLSINNHGIVTGAASTDADPVPHAILFNAGECIPVAPTTVVGSSFSIGSGINEARDVVGVYFDNATGFQHGFLRSRTGAFKLLDFPTADDTWASGINDSGVVVGYWDQRDANGNVLALHGFVWKNNSFSDVTIEGSANTELWAINARGDYVGSWDTGTLASHGFAVLNGTRTSIEIPISGTVGVQPTGINAKGQIAGVFWPDPQMNRGFIKTGSGYLIVDYPGAYWTNIWGINSAGQFTGWWFDSNFVPHGFVGVIEK